MEEIKELNWSWKEFLSPSEQFNKFKKTFTENDILHCHLNDLHPNFNIPQCKNENDQNKYYDRSKKFIVDPRNNKMIEKYVVDYTDSGQSNRETSIYKKIPKKSSLTEAEHAVCLHVIDQLQKKEIISELDKKIFDDTAAKRTEEYKLFMDFLIEQLPNQPIPQNEKKLNDTYKSYLMNESKLILGKTNCKFILQTALPLPWSFHTQNEGKLSKCRIVKQKGHVPQYNNIDFKKMKYLENILNKLPESECNKISNNNFNNIYDYDVIIPEDTLIILCGAFEDYPLGWEFTLEIRNTNEDHQFLIFENPFPLRFINYTTNTFVFEEKLKQFLNKSNEFNWLQISKNGLINENNDIEEINAVNLNMDYRIKKIDENFVKNESQKIKTNNIMINCELNNVKTDNNLNLLIINSNLDFCDDKEIPNYINLSLKLQYKIQYGYEVMTKSELIKEWIRQTIIPNSTTKRSHIDVNTFDTLLNENLTLIDIEDDLSNLYNIKPLNVIASLEEFFKMIMVFPSGKYLLKYDPLHNTKLMIYKEENEKIMESSTLSKHQLYTNVLENCSSMQNKNIIPISTTMVTQFHQHYKVLPSCFPYWCNSVTGISNDRKLIISRKINLDKNINKRSRKRNLAKKNKKNNRFKRKLI